MSEKHPIFAAVYDACMLPQDWLGFRGQRERTAGAAAGRVLEVGLGTGLNLHLYRSASAIVGIEPDPCMLRRAEPRARKAPAPVELVTGSGEELPFPDASFDSVVATLVFCTIPDAPRAAREIRRVLKPEGAFHFFEHVRAGRPWVAQIQDRIAPMWRTIFAGCHPNRDTLAIFQAAGLRIEKLWTSRPGIMIQGTARL